MRAFLLSATAPGIVAIAVIEFILAMFLWRSGSKKFPAIFCLAALTSGLAYDAIILALGRFLPDVMLLPLSQARFILSGALIPLLLPISGYVLGWKKPAMTVVWIITVTLAALGVAAACFEQLEIVGVAHVVRCASSDATPAWAKAVNGAMAGGMVVPLLLAGIVLLFRGRGPLVLLAAVLMFAAAAFAPATGNTDLNFATTMVGEVLMVLFLAWYFLADKRRTLKAEKAAKQAKAEAAKAEAAAMQAEAAPAPAEVAEAAKAAVEVAAE